MKQCLTCQKEITGSKKYCRVCNKIKKLLFKERILLKIGRNPPPRKKKVAEIPIKLTICKTCQTKFKHDKNQKRKYCSQSCSAKDTDHLKRRTNKPLRISFKKQSYLWKEYWSVKLYNADLKMLSPMEYHEYDLIQNYQQFHNNKA